MSGIRQYYSMSRRLMAADDPSISVVNAVIYRWPDPSLRARWEADPESPPEAWGARPMGYVGGQPGPVTVEREPYLVHWWRWLAGLRVRNPRRFLVLFWFLGPLVMTWGFLHGHVGLGWLAFFVTVAAVFIGME